MSIEIKVGDFLLRAQDDGGHGAKKTTIIVCNNIGNELGKADAHELQTAIMALEATCWRVGGVPKSGKPQTRTTTSGALMPPEVR